MASAALRPSLQDAMAMDKSGPDGNILFYHIDSSIFDSSQTRMIKRLLLIAIVLSAAGCGLSPVKRDPAQPRVAVSSGLRSDVVLYAMGLIDTDYRFGGSNPASGLDCSGMVSYIFEHAAGVKLPHSAYRIAEIGREIELSQLQPGDLVFFNTSGEPFSHVGIYVGRDQFIHAPSTNGRIKTSSFRSGYYAGRLVAARTLFE